MKFGGLPNQGHCLQKFARLAVNFSVIAYSLIFFNTGGGQPIASYVNWSCHLIQVIYLRVKLKYYLKNYLNKMFFHSNCASYVYLENWRNAQARAVSNS